MTIEIDGMLTPSVSLPKRIVVLSTGYTMVAAGDFGIFALRRQPTGDFTNVVEDGWIMPAKQAVSRRTLHPANAAAALAIEMEAILTTPREQMKDQRSGVNIRPNIAIYGFEDSQYDSAVQVLTSLPPAIYEPILRSLQSKSDESLRLWAAVGLLGRFDFDVLRSLEPLLIAPPHKAKIALEAFGQRLSTKRLPAATNETAILLLKSTAGAVRGAAANALANSPSPEIRQTIADLIQTENDDEALHQEASALCRIMHDIYRACGDVLSGDGLTPNSFWRQWAQDQLKKPMPPPDDVNP